MGKETNKLFHPEEVFGTWKQAPLNFMYYVLKQASTLTPGEGENKHSGGQGDKQALSSSRGVWNGAMCIEVDC